MSWIMEQLKHENKKSKGFIHNWSFGGPRGRYCSNHVGVNVHDRQLLGLGAWKSDDDLVVPLEASGSNKKSTAKFLDKSQMLKTGLMKSTIHTSWENWEVNATLVPGRQLIPNTSILIIVMPWLLSRMSDIVDSIGTRRMLWGCNCF